VTTHNTVTPNQWQALVFVRLPGAGRARFERFLRREPAVIAAWYVVGEIDMAVQVSWRDLPDLDRLIDAMRVEGGAVGTVTHLVVGQPDLSVPRNEPCEPAARVPGRRLASTRL
jgi:DNA-binding Lrp family transcriptional regulator